MASEKKYNRYDEPNEGLKGKLHRHHCTGDLAGACVAGFRGVQQLPCVRQGGVLAFCAHPHCLSPVVEANPGSTYDSGR